ncbi:MAG TPA: M28 family peptidase [Flavobacterium sp.]|jgi:hypothetical protein
MKTLYLPCLALTLIASACSAQKAKSTADPLSYMNTITAAELQKHLYIIASDDMQGRNTGEPGQKKAGKYLVSQYKSDNIPFPKGASDYYQPIPSSFFTKPFSPKLGDSENIWAFVEGTDKKDEIIVVSAHYDHVGMKNGDVYNGADDDGSGTVALLEIAQAFQLAKKDGNGPRRSILFLHVTGEEHGLHGSRYYSENPLFPLKKTMADINIDMIGRRDLLHPDTSNYVYVIGSDRLSTDLHKITEDANRNYTKLDLDYKYNDLNDPERFYYRSDHYNFAKNGIPSVFLFNGTHADYHQPTDDPDKIEYDALAKRAKLAFGIAWQLANREAPLTIDKDGK